MRQAQLLPILLMAYLVATVKQKCRSALDLKLPTLLLAGDPRQLGPVLKCRFSNAAGGGISLIEQLVGVSALPSAGGAIEKLRAAVESSMSLDGDCLDKSERVQELMRRL